jgi:hypothetical protein
MAASDTDLQVVDSFIYPHDAFLARTALEAAGIQAVIADDHIIAMDWRLAYAVGGIKLQVRTSDLAEAREILAAAREAALAREADEEPDPCSRCGSTNTTRLTIKRPAFLAWLLLGAPLFPVLRRVSCQNCGYLGKRTKVSISDSDEPTEGRVVSDGAELEPDSGPEPTDTPHEP